MKDKNTWEKKKKEGLWQRMCHKLRFLSYLSFVLACFFSLTIAYSVWLILVTSLVFLLLSWLSYEDIFMKRRIYRWTFLLSSEEYVYWPLLCVSLLSFYYSQYSLRFSYTATLVLFVVAYCLVLWWLERKKGKKIRKKRMTETIHYLSYGWALISLWSLYRLFLW